MDDGEAERTWENVDRPLWMMAQQDAMRRLWDNADDDVYNSLLDNDRDSRGET